MGTQLAKDLSGKVKVSTSEGQASTIQYQLQNVIMDGDTTTIAHLHDEVDQEIALWSDVGHAKKALYGHLLKLGGKHKMMSKTVVEYLIKCFG